MPDNYQKLYAYLVGQVDDAIRMIDSDLFRGRHGYDELFTVGDKLKTALMTAEKMYLDETGAE